MGGDVMKAMSERAAASKVRLRPGIQWLGLHILILDEKFQPRGETNLKWCNYLSARHKEGSVFDPIVVFQLPDGRLVVVAGFHRYTALQLAGETDIRCDVRNGTEEEAIVFAAGSNRDADGKRKMTDGDITKAVEMLFQIESWWTTSNSLVAEHVGCSNAKVGMIRARISLETGRSIPDRILTSRGNTLLRKGRHQLRQPEDAEKLTVYVVKDEEYAAGVKFQCSTRVTDSDGKLRVRTVTGPTEESVRAKLRLLLEENIQNKQVVRARQQLRRAKVGEFLKRRAFKGLVKGGNNHRYPGIVGWYRPGMVIVACEFAGNHQLPQAIGVAERAIVALDIAAGQSIACQALSRDASARKIILCYKEDGPFWLIDLYRQAGFEFMTPDELIESLK